MKKLYFLILTLLSTNFHSTSFAFSAYEGQIVYECTLETFVVEGKKKTQIVIIDTATTDPTKKSTVVAIAPELNKITNREHYFTYTRPSLSSKTVKLKLSVVFLDGETVREHVYSEAKGNEGIRLVASKPNKKWSPSILECNKK